MPEKVEALGQTVGLNRFGLLKGSWDLVTRVEIQVTYICKYL